MATEHKKASDIATKNNIDLNNDYLMGVNGTSNINIKASAFKDVAKEASLVNVDGVFILYYHETFPCLVRPKKWDMLKNEKTALGVVVVEGDKKLVIALDESSSNWSSAAFSAGALLSSDIRSIINDWSGKGNTEALINDNRCVAAAYCNSYSANNTQSNKLNAGYWCLPSVAELMLIYANLTKINYVLSLINGATLISETALYWCSTEHSATYAWTINFFNGQVDGKQKVNQTLRVRPVSEIS